MCLWLGFQAQQRQHGHIKLVNINNAPDVYDKITKAFLNTPKYHIKNNKVLISTTKQIVFLTPMPTKNTQQTTTRSQYTPLDNNTTTNPKLEIT